MEKVQIGRLAFRHEGNYWNAYYAQNHTMDDAVLLGSILINLLTSKERAEAFRSVMQECFADMIEEKTGVRPFWPHAPQPAPEHERAGHG